MTKRAKKLLIPILVIAGILSSVLYFCRTFTRFSFSALTVTDPVSGAVTELNQEDSALYQFCSALRDYQSYREVKGTTYNPTELFGKKLLNVTARTGNGKAKGYEIYLESIFQRTAYFRDLEKDRFYRLSAENFTKLFSQEPFASALPNKEPPTPLLYEEAKDGTTVAAAGTPLSGNWNYACADGKQKTQTVEGQPSDEYYLFAGGTPFSVFFSLQPSEMTVSLYKVQSGTEKGEKLYTLETDGTAIPLPKEDGYYYYELEAHWPTVSTSDFNGAVVYGFNIKIELPSSPVLTKAALPQGQVTALRILNSSGEDTVTAFCERLGYRGSFTAVEGVPTSLIGIPMDTEPGVYEISVVTGDRATSVYLTVTEGKFPSQRLSLSTDVNESWVEEQNTYLTPFRNYVSEEDFITGRFSEPVQGNITTAYGTFRYTKGSEIPTRHNGIDISGKRNPAILAPMRGKVVFTMNMKLTGNTVVIDHGMNVLSYYYHLDSITVEEGQIVETGDKIGTMGSTGNAKGDHLHYTVMVNGVSVDPNVFYGTDFSCYEESHEYETE